MQLTIVDILILLLWLGVSGALAYLVFYLFSLPLRRKERAQLFLDLIESGLRRGQIPEATIRSAAGSGDRLLGVRFLMLGAWLESGLRLDQALERIPGFVPSEIISMLRAGHELGDLGKVIGACRLHLEDAVNKVFQGQHYLMAFLLGACPVWLVVYHVFVTFLLPRFRVIMEEAEIEFPGHLVWVVDKPVGIVAVAVLLFVACCVGAALYICGPAYSALLNRVFGGLIDRLAYLVPWRRKRMQRDFSVMLSLLLDANVPEARAVRLAAESTANRVFKENAERVVLALESGTPLTTAVRHLDESGEFVWRLENAALANRRFAEGLASWHEALAAQAFQLEQAAAQVITSALVVMNGVLVALLAMFTFSILTAILSSSLW